MKLVLKGLACCALAGLVWLLLGLPGVRSLTGSDLRVPEAHGGKSQETSLEIAAASARVPSVSGSDSKTGGETGPSVVSGDISSRLRAVARAYAESSVEVLESNLEALLGDPRDAFLVLERLSNGSLADDLEALQGAILTVVAGVQLYDQPGWTGRAECSAFLWSVLEAMPRVPMPWLEQLVTGLAEARTGERPILGVSHLPKILALRAENPELAPVISRLLESVADDLMESGGAEQLHSILLGETRDPTAVGVSLSALLATRAEDFLPVAEEMYSRARDDPELAGAITQAIAASAPVDQATSALARMTDGSQFLEFHVLGTREGALESLSSEYNALVAQGDHPQARTMLVAGMGAEREEILLGIAATDADSRVRAQAFLTGSLGRAVGPEFVEALREAHFASGDERRGIDPDASVAIANNVLLGTPGKPRDAARKLLLEIAGDESIRERARWKAVAAVRPWVPDGTFRGLFIGGRAVE